MAKTKKLTLRNLVKELKSTRVTCPKPATIISWLSGTEYSADTKKLDTEYDEKMYRECKQFIEKTIKTKNQEKRTKAKAEKVYFYISVGGTKELQNMFKIDVSDHIMTRVTTPKGCANYCTENQIGSARNWVRLPPVLLSDGLISNQIMKIFDSDTMLTKLSPTSYRYNGKDANFLPYMKKIHKFCSDISINSWFKTTYNI